MTAAGPLAGAALVAAAERLATSAHAGQVDKAGAPYLGHPRRVVGHLLRAAPEAGPEAVATAWLHDVVEDSAHGLEELRALGFPERVVAAVEALTRRPGEGIEAYLGRVQADPVALLVKRADLADNTDPDRMALLDAPTRARLTAKYARYREVLEG